MGFKKKPAGVPAADEGPKKKESPVQEVQEEGRVPSVEDEARRRWLTVA